MPNPLADESTNHQPEKHLPWCSSPTEAGLWESGVHGKVSLAMFDWDQELYLDKEELNLQTNFTIENKKVVEALYSLIWVHKIAVWSLLSVCRQGWGWCTPYSSVASQVASGVRGGEIHGEGRLSTLQHRLTVQMKTGTGSLGTKCSRKWVAWYKQNVARHEETLPEELVPYKESGLPSVVSI